MYHQLPGTCANFSTCAVLADMSHIRQLALVKDCSCAKVYACTAQSTAWQRRAGVPPSRSKPEHSEPSVHDWTSKHARWAQSAQIAQRQGVIVGADQSEHNMHARLQSMHTGVRVLRLGQSRQPTGLICVGIIALWLLEECQTYPACHPSRA